MKHAALFLGGLLIGFWIVASVYFFFPQTQEAIAPLATPQATPFSVVAAPTDSLSGEMTALSGDVKWESRVATEPAELKTAVTVHQGEKIVTGEDGLVDMLFADILAVSISQNCDLEIAQLLPESFVFEQKKGSVSFEKLGTTPIAVRALDLLVEPESGKLMLSVNDEAQTVTVAVYSGSATVAYNDAEWVSQVLPVSEGTTFVFDSATRTHEVTAF